MYWSLAGASTNVNNSAHGKILRAAAHSDPLNAHRDSMTSWFSASLLSSPGMRRNTGRAPAAGGPAEPEPARGSATRTTNISAAPRPLPMDRGLSMTNLFDLVPDSDVTGGLHRFAGVSRPALEPWEHAPFRPLNSRALSRVVEKTRILTLHDIVLSSSRAALSPLVLTWRRQGHLCRAIS
jgi:hypothetical protein